MNKTKQQLLDEIEHNSKRITECKKEIEALEAKPSGRWVPNKGELYYYTDLDGDTRETSNDGNYFCESLIAHGNCFETEDICDYEARRQGAMNRLRAWARAQNGDWKADWEDKDQTKYVLLFSYFYKKWKIDWISTVKDPEKIYFASYKLAERCRDECADDWNILADLEGGE